MTLVRVFGHHTVKMLEENSPVPTAAVPGGTIPVMIKRTLDCLISGAQLVILSPLLLAIAVLVKLTSPGPVSFRQIRVVLNRRQFSIYKIRVARPFRYAT